MTTTVAFERMLSTITHEEKRIQLQKLLEILSESSQVMIECRYFISQLIVSVESEKDFEYIWSIIHTRYSTVTELVECMQRCL